MFVLLSGQTGISCTRVRFRQVLNSFIIDSILTVEIYFKIMRRNGLKNEIGNISFLQCHLMLKNYNRSNIELKIDAKINNRNREI